MILDSYKNALVNEDVELSPEGEAKLCEIMITESGCDFSDAELSELMSEGLLAEANFYKVKNDKKTKAKRLVGAAAIQIAKEKNDPLYKKLKKVYAQRRMLKEAINKKYGNKAVQKVKKMQQNNRILAAKDIPIDKNTKPKDA